ncbi:MAG: hypothetical protein ACYDEE_12550 [Ignavibacteriaceae bacterium]
MIGSYDGKPQSVEMDGFGMKLIGNRRGTGYEQTRVQMFFGGVIDFYLNKMKRINGWVPEGKAELLGI